jgi:hypothetical protein
MCGLRLERFASKEEDVEGSVVTGTSDSFWIEASRPKLEVSDSRELN